MHIGILTFTFSLPGCKSLKEKRHRIGSLHQRFGRNPAIAVCESDEHHTVDISVWSFVVVANAKREVQSVCSQIENKIQDAVDGRVIDVEKEFL